MTNICQWDSVCCSDAELAYEELYKKSPQEISNFYMSWYRPELTTIYPWKRSTTVIPMDYDLCSMPNGVPDKNTKIGIRLYRAPTNDLPCACKAKCAACRDDGRNCGTCQDNGRRGRR